MSRFTGSESLDPRLRAVRSAVRPRESAACEGQRLLARLEDVRLDLMRQGLWKLEAWVSFLGSGSYPPLKALI
jgi:hypothetical protein